MFQIRWSSSPIVNSRCDIDFKKKLRDLHGTLKDDEEMSCRSHALPSVLRLLCALPIVCRWSLSDDWWDLAAIGKTTAHKSFHKLTRAICSKRRLLLKFPTDLTEVKRRFFNIAVPKCGGSYRLYSYTCTITRGRQCRGFQKSKKIFFSKRAGDMLCQSYYHEHCGMLARKNTRF